MWKQKSKPKRKCTEYRVYRLSVAMRLTLSAIMFLFIVLIVELVRPASTIPIAASFIIPAIQLGAISYGIWWTWQTIFVDRLVISDEGIDFFAMGIKGFVDWNNLGWFDWVAHNRTRYWGIKLYEETPLQMDWIARFSGYKNYFGNFLPITHWTSQRWSFLRRIDIDSFKQTPLGQDLLQYAPHLFEDENSKPTSNIVNT